MDQMARTYAQAKAGLLPDEPVVVCGQPTVVDPSRAPDGQTCVVVAGAHGAGRPSKAMRPAPFLTATDMARMPPTPFAERALDILERYAPGTRDKILGQHIVTPDMLQADNPNLVGGDQICGSHHLHQHFMNRPARGYRRRHHAGQTSLSHRCRRLARWQEPAPGPASCSPKNLPENSKEPTKSNDQGESRMTLSRRSAAQVLSRSRDICRRWPAQFCPND